MEDRERAVAIGLHSKAGDEVALAPCVQRWRRMDDDVVIVAAWITLATIVSRRGT
jgi:hypothetical protein